MLGAVGKTKQLIGKARFEFNTVCCNFSTMETQETQDQLSVLVVEDEAFIADELCLQLAKLGYNVLGHTTTGEEAIKMAAQLRPNVILLDVELEGQLDGIETALLLRREVETVIIFLTQYTDSTTFARARKAGPAAFLEKPFNPGGLKTTVQLALDRQRGVPYHYGLANSSIFLRNREQHVKIPLRNILCVRAERAYCQVITLDGQSYQQSVPMNAMVGRIQSANLMQIHKSVTLNLDHVTAVAGNELTAAGQSLVLGKIFSRLVKQRLGL